MVAPTPPMLHKGREVGQEIPPDAFQLLSSRDVLLSGAAPVGYALLRCTTTAYYMGKR